MGEPVRVRAPAKINWTLEVVGRRPDGYHEVCTVLQTIGLWDELTILPASSLTVRCQGPFAVEDELVARAVRAIDPQARVEVIIHKAIPPASGLGGGSSDAAAALRALCRLRGWHLPQERLMEVAASLGSDVPFFLLGGTALARGRGEQLSPLADAPQVWLVLVVPPLRVSDKTARMYRLLTPASYSDGTFTQRFLERLWETQRVDENYMYNAFESVSYSLFPEIARYRAALLEAGARRVHLAGSGPALFALASGRREAQALAARVKAPGAHVIVTCTVGRREALG
jgi:4-diphosphocytidyl-2-C-methyl-D-erythritol kinase